MRISNRKHLFPTGSGQDVPPLTRRKKERHKPCAIPVPPPPSLPRAITGSGASGAGTVPSIQRSGCNTAALDARTTACDCRRRRKPPPRFMTFPRPRLCLGQKWNPVPEIKYNTFHVRVNAGNRPDYRFFPGNWRFFQHVQVCCTSFIAGSVRRRCPLKPTTGPPPPPAGTVCRRFPVLFPDMPDVHIPWIHGRMFPISKQNPEGMKHPPIFSKNPLDFFRNGSILIYRKIDCGSIMLP